MSTCPDLKALAAGRYRVTWECPLDEEPTAVYQHDRWAAMVPTETGHLFPFGADKLGVWVEPYHRRLVEELVSIGCTIRTVGSDGTTLLCTVGLFDQVAALTKARRRRKMSPEQRAAAVEWLAGFAFKPAAQSDFGGLVCPQTALVDMEHVRAEASVGG